MVVLRICVLIVRRGQGMVARCEGMYGSCQRVSRLRGDSLLLRNSIASWCFTNVCAACLRKYVAQGEARVVYVIILTEVRERFGR